MPRRPRHSERGASAVEFALVFPILFLIAVGIIQYGWYFYVAENASGAASNVTRRLAVGDCWSGSDAENLAKAQAPQVTNVNFTPADLGTAEVGVTQITVTLEANADLLDFLPLPDGGVVTRTLSARLEDLDPEACT